MASIFMVRDNLDNIPQYDLPVGCNIHTLRPGEEKLWEWVCEGAFANDFGSDFTFDFDRMMRSDKCFAPERVFLGQQYAQVTATASAWHDPKFGANTGILHWVATHPTASGDGLGRPVIAAALNAMRDMGYTRAILTTQEYRLPAIRLYKEFGFHPVYDEADRYEPEVRPESDDSAAQAYSKSIWDMVERKLGEFKPKHLETIQLWPQGAPLFDESIDQKQPSMTWLPVEGSKGAVIVCPGGGYVMKATHEGAPIARMLNQAGISAFVLDYRVAPYVMPAPVLDVNRAVKVARSLGYEKVGVLGFSAGGHLTAMAGTMYDTGKPDDPDPIEHFSSRPDAFVPCYAVISMAEFTHHGSRMNIMGKDVDNWKALRNMSGELRVTPDTPPCFMWHTASDGAVPVENSLNMAAACVKNGVPVELHIFPEGPHGMGLAGGVPAGQWCGLCQKWLLDLGFGK